MISLARPRRSPYRNPYRLPQPRRPRPLDAMPSTDQLCSQCNSTTTSHGKGYVTWGSSCKAARAMASALSLRSTVEGTVRTAASMMPAPKWTRRGTPSSNTMNKHPYVASQADQPGRSESPDEAKGKKRWRIKGVDAKGDGLRWRGEGAGSSERKGMIGREQVAELAEKPLKTL